MWHFRPPFWFARKPQPRKGQANWLEHNQVAVGIRNSLLTAPRIHNVIVDVAGSQTASQTPSRSLRSRSGILSGQQIWCLRLYVSQALGQKWGESLRERLGWRESWGERLSLLDMPHKSSFIYPKNKLSCHSVSCIKEFFWPLWLKGKAFIQIYSHRFSFYKGGLGSTNDIAPRIDSTLQEKIQSRRETFLPFRKVIVR